MLLFSTRYIAKSDSVCLSVRITLVIHAYEWFDISKYVSHHTIERVPGVEAKFRSREFKGLLRTSACRKQKCDNLQ